MRREEVGRGGEKEEEGGEMGERRGRLRNSGKYCNSMRSGPLDGSAEGRKVNVSPSWCLILSCSSSSSSSSAARRVLKVFLSRTAQRIPYMTSWRVLRLLAIILLVVCWFLVAWTSAVCQNPDRKSSLIDVGFTARGLQFSLCLLDRWDYMMAVGKLRDGCR